jgi:5-(carboxyamino)imidazole ribonucleotide mutase
MLARLKAAAQAARPAASAQGVFGDSALCWREPPLHPLCHDMTAAPPRIGLIMGSRSDWETMQHGSKVLDELGIEHEVRIVSAHRTPDWLMEYAGTAEQRGLEVIIAGAGGAAHLPGMAASKTTLPVLGVPIEVGAMRGMDALLSIVQMPAGVPVGTLAVGKAGAINAALLAASIVGAKDPAVRQRLAERRRKTAADVLAAVDPREGGGG